MFLAELNDTKKELFLDLSLHLSMCDGEFVDAEKSAILQMCREMEVAERFAPDNDFDDALNQIAEGATIREKRIILLEIGGVILADGAFSAEEEGAMKRIADFLEVDYSHCEKVILIIQDLYKVYSQIGSFLSGR